MFFIFFIEQLIGSELDYVALGMNMYVVQFFDFNLFMKHSVLISLFLGYEFRTYMVYNVQFFYFNLFIFIQIPISELQY